MNYQHKIGDSFKIYGPLRIEGATDYASWSASAQLRDPRDTLIAALRFRWLDASTGLAQLDFAGSTADWPECAARLDIEMTSPSGKVVSTPTAIIEIARDVTR